MPRRLMPFLRRIYGGDEHPDKERNEANASNSTKFGQYQSYCTKELQDARDVHEQPRLREI